MNESRRTERHPERVTRSVRNRKEIRAVPVWEYRELVVVAVELEHPPSNAGNG